MSNSQSQLTENLNILKDKQTNPLKRAYLIQKITSEKNLSKKELAYLINKSPSYISNYLRLIDLPEVIKDALLSGILSEGHARALTFLSTKEETIHLFEDIVRFNYSVRETESKVDRLRKNKRQYGKVADELKSQTELVSEKWSLPVKITRRQMNIKLSFYFPLGVVGLRKLKLFLSKILV